MNQDINQQMRQLKADADSMTAGRAGWDRGEYGDGQFSEGVFASQVTGERWMAWHGLGTYLENEPTMTYERVIEEVPAFGSDYVKLPAYVELDGERIELPAAGVIRAMDNHPIGAVHPNYPLIPPYEAFDFLRDLINQDGLPIISAVLLRGGAQMVVTIELPGHIEVAGWTDETIRKLIVLDNSFDSKGALGVACSPVRGECINSTRLTFSQSPRVWRTRHTSGVRDRMNEARHTLQLASRYFADVETMANRLVEKRMPRRDFDRFVGQLIPYTPQMEADPGGRAAKNRERAVEAITNAFVNSPNLQNVRGTKWGALQAVLEWNQWDRPVRETKRDGKVVATGNEQRFHRALLREQPIETRAMKMLIG